MTMCNMEALASYFKKLLPMSILLFKNWSKVKGQKVKYQHKDLITRDIHVKYKSSCNHYSKVGSKIVGQTLRS